MDLRVAAYAVITDTRGRVLLSRWIGGHTPAWTMPGGGMESGEHPEATCVREVREETGYAVEIDEILGIDSMVIPASRRLSGSSDLQGLRIIYRAHIVGGELTNEVGGSTDRAEWFPRDVVRSLERTGLVDVALRLDSEAQAPAGKAS